MGSDFLIKPNQKIEVKIISSNYEYYRSLGYKCNKGDIIYVKAEDLSHGSHKKITIVCDHCKKNEYLSTVADYYKCHDETMGDFCIECRHIKIENTCLKNFGYKHPLQNADIYKKSQDTLKRNYGVDYTLQSKVIKEKAKNTTYEHLGVEYSLQSKEVREKSKQTCLKKYGVEYAMKLEETQEKAKETCLNKYGVEYPIQNEQIYQKIVNTNFKKYNVSNPMKNPEIKQKAMDSMLNDENIRISKPQIECGELLKEIYPNVKNDVLINNFCLDFLLDFNNCKIDVEYDGWYWHSSSESKRRDLIRDKVLQKDYGIKTLRIRSAYLIPSKEQIIESVNQLRNTDKKYTQIILSDWKDN